MKRLITKRILATTIDYILVMLYVILLFGITITFFETENIGPIKGQVIGLFILTLPVFCYFYFSEIGIKKATLGKIITKISVDSNHNKNILYRSIFKFLPWEIAHFGVHWMYYFNREEITEPFWVWISLILPQIVVVIYIVSFISSKDNTTVYDQLTNTKIIIKN